MVRVRVAMSPMLGMGTLGVVAASTMLYRCPSGVIPMFRGPPPDAARAASNVVCHDHVSVGRQTISAMVIEGLGLAGCAAARSLGGSSHSDTGLVAGSGIASTSTTSATSGGGAGAVAGSVVSRVRRA
jgi:hypothetical protein